MIFCSAYLKVFGFLIFEEILVEMLDTNKVKFELNQSKLVRYFKIEISFLKD